MVKDIYKHPKLLPIVMEMVTQRSLDLLFGSRGGLDLPFRLLFLDPGGGLDLPFRLR